MKQLFSKIKKSLTGMAAGFNKKVLIYSFVILFTVILLIYAIKFILKKRVRVGVLFTTEGGPMALNEKRLSDMVLQTIHLYNKSQDKVYLEPYSYNPQSSTELYQEGSETLISKDVALVFGCWRSVDRKAILPIFEKHNHLLCYSVQYEGQECSKNVLYFGACPNQQINIGIEYGIKNISPKIVLIGSDYVFPRTANGIMKEYIQQMKAELLDEIYVGMTETNFAHIVQQIIAKNKNNEKVLIVNTINGESNKYFFETLYREFKKNKDNENVILSSKYPVLSFSLTENDIQEYESDYISGNYFIWNYSQTDISYDAFLNHNYKHNTEISNTLIQNLKRLNYIIDDPTYHAFLSVLFFINFIDTYQGPLDSQEIRKQYLKSFDVKQLTPTGYLSILSNNHLEQPSYILKANTNKRFETIYQTPIEIKPNPWFNRFAQKHYSCNNKTFLGSYYLENYDAFSMQNHFANQMSPF